MPLTRKWIEQTTVGSTKTPQLYTQWAKPSLWSFWGSWACPWLILPTGIQSIPLLTNPGHGGQEWTERNAKVPIHVPAEFCFSYIAHMTLK